MLQQQSFTTSNFSSGGLGLVNKSPTRSKVYIIASGHADKLDEHFPTTMPNSKSFIFLL